MLGAAMLATPLQVQPLTITVDSATISHPDARRLLGTSFDARASFQLNGTPIGYFDPFDATPLATGEHWLRHAPRTSLRYPQGPVNVWNWKSAIGPIASRPAQPTLGQAAAFGLDEMMVVIAQSTDMNNDDLNMMVNIYQPGLLVGGSAISDAADLVAYMNLAEGTGHPWAIQRAANGYAEPFGVTHFNLGNEPWSAVEYDYRSSGASDPTQDGALRFASDMQPFVDAMLAVDPALALILPVPSPASSLVNQTAGFAWQQTQLDALGDRIHGLAANIYYDGRQPASRGVQSMEAFLDQTGTLLASYNASHNTNVQLIIGEHAHAIDIDYSTNPPTTLTPDFAMQWHGAVDSADFLAMLAQKAFVERAHFFIYGNGAAAWHPYRSNGIHPDGTQDFTVMPAAQLYESLNALVYSRALSITIDSHSASDGAAYAVRAAAFVDPQATRLSLLIVNRDPALTESAQIVGIDGWLYASATLLTAGSADAEIITRQRLALDPPPAGFALPPLSLLLLQLNHNGAPYRDGFEAF